MKYIDSPYFACCPVCGHQKNSLLYQVSSNEAANHFAVISQVEKDIADVIEQRINDLWQQDWAAVISCHSCEFVFAKPFIGGDYEFYNLLPHSTGEGPELWKWEFNKTYETIVSSGLNKNNPKLLEIGASTGDFIKRMAGMLPKKDLFCLEYSRIGKRAIEKAGISVDTADFREWGNDVAYYQKFNIVCLFQILEHLDRLDDVFDTFNKITAPEGHLFIGVPNPEKTRFNELNNALLDMPPNHIGRYKAKTFQYLGKKYGWDILEVDKEPYTALDVMRSVMYYRSLKKAQMPSVKETNYYKLTQYIELKLLRLKAIFRHEELGEAMWIHLKKKADENFHFRRSCPPSTRNTNNQISGP